MVNVPAGPRVLAVTGAYFPEFSAGGLQTQEVARALRDRVSMRVLTTATTPALAAHDAVDGIPVSRVVIDPASRVARLSATWRLLGELLRTLPRVDLVHIQGVSSKNVLIVAMAKLFARPVVLHLQTAKHDEPPAVKALGRAAWWAFGAADRYLSVSPALAAAACAAGVPGSRIREVPNGVDERRFRPSTADERRAARGRLDLPADRPMVLFVGVMMPDKQPHVLLEAWMRLQSNLPSTLVFVGATDPKLFELGDRLADRLRADADRSGFGDRVIFRPPTRKIEDYFLAADVFAMPSAREGLPIVLLEAMASGLPCVASRLAGSTDVLVDDGVNGRLVPPGDAGALANALGDILARPDEARRMGAAARKTVEGRYTIDRVAGEWLAVYADVLGRRP